MMRSRTTSLPIAHSFSFCKDTATTDIYTDGHTLSLHAARPISRREAAQHLDLAGTAMAQRDLRRRRPAVHHAIDQPLLPLGEDRGFRQDRKSTRLNSSH